jgi:xanthine dehydrogenase accessory factor
MREIINEINEWSEGGAPVAVATVIETWGSAPRGVGAKMALTPDHHIAGSVSGGCVEGAVFEAGVETLESGQSQLLHFGVADETAFEAVGLACGGTIEVFVEPLTPALRDFWRNAFTQDIPIATATIVRGPKVWIGYKLMLDSDGRVQASGVSETPEIYDALLSAAQAALREGASRRIVVTPSPQPSSPLREDVPPPRGEGEEAEAFIEVILPKPTLIIVGAVHIAIALATMAKALGYRVVIVDPRSAFGNEDRFPHADQLVKDFPDRALNTLPITRSTAIVTLTHDARFDDAALKIALRSPAFYVGALGGRKTREARRERLLAAGVTEVQMNRLHAPIGIDIGTRTPEEIALATMAHIVAARNGANNA